MLIKHILLSIAIFQGLVIGFILLNSLFFKSKINRYLAFAIFSLTWSLLNLALDISQAFHRFPFLKIVDILDSEVLYPVLIFLFVIRKVNHPKKNSKCLIWLFAPYILSVVYSVLDEINAGFNTALFPNSVIITLEVLALLVTILFLPFILWKTYQYIQFSKNKKEKKWLTLLWLIELIFLLSWLIAALIGIILNIDISSAMHIIALFASLSIYWVAYTGLYKLSLADERHKIRRLILENTVNNTTEPYLIAESEIARKSKFTKKEFARQTGENIYFKQLERLCTNQKIYIDSTLDRNKISEMLNISPSYVSQLVNSNTGGNLNTYLNQYRVEEVKKMIANEDFERYSLLAIGLECGFASNSTFHIAFKKLTGMTPNSYRKAINKS